MNDNSIKLQAFMAHCGIASRRACEVLIADGKVTVNGVKAHIGQRVVPNVDSVSVAGKKIVPDQPKRYFLIDKPKGYVSTTSDEMGRHTVLQLLPKDVTERIFPVGRLDLDSEGLMLLTNDGLLAQKLTHPRFEMEKTYHVMVITKPTFKAIHHLEMGVKLKDGYTQPAKVEILSTENDEVWIEITIKEGRNRQVRRMMERIGYPVEKLVRVGMGPFDLDMLDGKQVMEIPESEIKNLF